MKSKQIAALVLLLSLNISVSSSMENNFGITEDVVEMRAIEILEHDIENQVSQVTEMACQTDNINNYEQLCCKKLPKGKQEIVELLVLGGLTFVGDACSNWAENPIYAMAMAYATGLVAASITSDRRYKWKLLGASLVGLGSGELDLTGMLNSWLPLAAGIYFIHTTKKDYMKIREAVRRFARDFRRFPVIIQEKIMTGMSQFIGGLRQGGPLEQSAGEELDDTTADASHVIYISQDESDDSDSGISC